ncbi:MAG: AraC family transcriptional regulator [Bacteroidota bacterium]
MYYQSFDPPVQISHIVRSIWIVEGNEEGNGAFNHRLFADNCANLVFHYRNHFREIKRGQPGSYLHDAVLHGQSTGFEDMRVDGPFGILGIYLYPQATKLLFGLPASEITNTIIPLDVLDTRGLEPLEERLAVAVGHKERVNYAFDYIISLLSKSQQPIDRRLHFCIDRILENSGNVNLDGLCDTAGLSTRQLERLFKQSAGLNPKLFSMITRFTDALTTPLGESARNLTELALQTGYSDQSHFIRDFKAFSGLSPKVYFKSLTHVADNFVSLE